MSKKPEASSLRLWGEVHYCVILWQFSETAFLSSSPILTWEFEQWILSCEWLALQFYCISSVHVSSVSLFIFWKASAIQNTLRPLNFLWDLCYILCCKIPVSEEASKNNLLHLFTQWGSAEPGWGRGGDRIIVSDRVLNFWLMTGDVCNMPQFFPG